MNSKIIDTNVPVVASDGTSEQAGLNCRLACIRLLNGWFKREFRLVIDSFGPNGTLGEALQEYRKRFYPDPNPSVPIGSRFLMEILNNIANPGICVLVAITRIEDSYVEFPQDARLERFDLSDRKWVAIAVAYKHQFENDDVPPIANATDSDWRDYRATLAEHGIRLEFVCDVPLASQTNRSRKPHRFKGDKGKTQ